MPKSVTVLLAVALVASNAWWGYKTIDNGVTMTYRSATLEESQQALSQALAIIKVASARGASRAKIVQAAQNAWQAGEPFEKDGYLWVGRLGLRFDSNGRLLEAIVGYADTQPILPPDLSRQAAPVR